MKKITASLFAALLIIFSAVFSLPYSAAEEFEISGNVLVKYNGSSNTVNVPDGVKIIGGGAFEGNSTTMTVNLPKGVYSIGSRAFYNCTSLKSVTNTESITDIGAYAFTNTAFVNLSQNDYASVNNILVGFTGVESEVGVPSGITAIAPYVFAGNTRLTAATLPSSLRSIGEGAFYGCSSLKNATVPNGVKNIGAFAFSGTSWVENHAEPFVIAGDGILIAYNGSETAVTVPHSVKQIAGGVFYGNPSIEKVVLQNGCIAVQMRAFANCANLKSVYLPETVEGIDPTAFENSSKVAIEGVNGSFAQKFADQNSIPFNLSSRIGDLGDVNVDGEINATDATLVLQAFSKIITGDRSDYHSELADVSGDGEINATDATLILQLFSKIIQIFPAEE